MTAVVKAFAIMSWDNAGAFMDFLVSITFSFFHALTLEEQVTIRKRNCVHGDLICYKVMICDHYDLHCFILYCI